MRDTRLVMGMPIEIEIVGAQGTRPALETAFARFVEADERFSTYRPKSEISRMNRGELPPSGPSEEMRTILELAERTKHETHGYFDIRRPDSLLDPSGIVKGWAIRNAAESIRAAGHEHFFVNAGGDIASRGMNADGEEWSIGIRDPFHPERIVKVVYPRGRGIATSGSYLRGAHIYDPHRPGSEITEIVSSTVIGPDVLEADRFATAAFAMGAHGIAFIEALDGFEGYQIGADGIATMTSGFSAYARP